MYLVMLVSLLGLINIWIVVLICVCVVICILCYWRVLSWLRSGLIWWRRCGVRLSSECVKKRSVSVSGNVRKSVSVRRSVSLNVV